jgi:hypothetical protein
MCPHWTTARKTKEKMVGDCNRPLALILEWKIMMIINYMEGSDLGLF